MSECVETCHKKIQLSYLEMVLLDTSQLVEKAPEGLEEIPDFLSVFPYPATCMCVCVCVCVCMRVCLCADSHTVKSKEIV